MGAARLVFEAWGAGLNRALPASPADPRPSGWHVVRLAPGAQDLGTAEVTGPSGTTRALAEVPRSARGGLRPLVVILPPEAGFARALRVPHAARWQARAVAGLEVGTLSPLTPEATALCVATTAPAPTGAEVIADVRLARADALAFWQAQARQAGLTPDAFDVAEGLTDAVADLARGLRPVAAPGQPARMVLLLLAGLGLLAATAVGLNALSADTGPVAVVAREVPLQPVVNVADLARLARALTDQESLESLEADPTELRLTGYSPSATDLPQRLQAAGFRDVRLIEVSREGVEPDATVGARDRFTLTLRRPSRGQP